MHLAILSVYSVSVNFDGCLKLNGSGIVMVLTCIISIVAFLHAIDG